MANEEQLAILKQGVKVWNEWREKTHSQYIDLCQADLSGAILTRANLRRAYLEETDLSGADLSNADLTAAVLTYANLSEASLEEAHLAGAILEGADLRKAILVSADLSRARLIYANLKEARIGNTIFGDNDLNGVRRLESVQHLVPSYVSIQTIYKSLPDIPDDFLRGCGVPENFIKYIRSLTGELKGIEYYSCFISYSSKDTDFAERLHADLQSNGVRVWFAPEDLKIGDKFRTRIDEAIKVYDKLLIVLSENSINSSWVEKEVEAAFEKENREKRVVLFPIRLDDSVMETDQAWAADIRRTRHIGDMSGWKDHDRYQKAFERLMRDLKASEEKQ